MTQIQFLTPEQTALIPEYQEKWRRVYLSTQPIEQVRAVAAIKGAYSVMKQPEPEVVFCSSPQAALTILEAHVAKADLPNVDPDLGPDGFPRDFSKTFLQTALSIITIKKKLQLAGIKPLHDLLQAVLRRPQKQIAKHINRRLPKDVSVKDIFEQGFSSTRPLSDTQNHAEDEGNAQSFDDFLGFEISPELDFSLIDSLFPLFPGKNFFLRLWLKGWIQGTLMMQIYGFSHPPFKNLVRSALSAQENMFLQENPPIVTSELVTMCTFIDFVKSVLKFPVPEQKWAALQGLVKYCGWILAVDGLCVVCDCPTHIRTNEKHEFYADGEPVLQYSDGFSLYAHDNAFIPEKYGSVPVSEWQIQWVLEEKNAAWQNALMQEFGAARLYQALATTEIEASGRYTLLSFDDVNTRNAYVLRQVDNETGEIYAVFSPQYVARSIQTAIQHAHHTYDESVFPQPK